MKKLSLFLALATSALAVAPGCALQNAPLDHDDNNGDAEELGVASQASSTDAFGWAWVLGNGTLGSPYAFNSSGGAVVTNKFATGRYTIELMGIALSPPMNGQAVAYGSSAHCKLFTIAVGDETKTKLSVNCYTAAGEPVDSAFVVTLDSRSGSATAPNRGAFLSTGTYGTTPAIFHSYNSAAGHNTVVWSAADQDYLVTLPGMSFDNASVQVTALGQAPNANRCKVASWSGGVVRVKCFDPSGAAVGDTGFSLTYQERSMLQGRAGVHASFSSGAMSALRRGGVGNLECDAPTFSSTPYQYSALVSITDTNASGNGQNLVPMVSGLGTSADYCNVGSWGTDGTTGNVLVSCFDATGSPIDTTSTGQFNLSLTQNGSPGPC